MNFNRQQKFIIYILLTAMAFTFSLCQIFTPMDFPVFVGTYLGTWLTITTQIFLSKKKGDKEDENDKNS